MPESVCNGCAEPIRSRKIGMRRTMATRRMMHRLFATGTPDLIRSDDKIRKHHLTVTAYHSRAVETRQRELSDVWHEKLTILTASFGTTADLKLRGDRVTRLNTKGSSASKTFRENISERCLHSVVDVPLRNNEEHLEV